MGYSNAEGPDKVCATYDSSVVSAVLGTLHASGRLQPHEENRCGRRCTPETWRLDVFGVSAGIYVAVAGRAIPVYGAVGGSPQSQVGFHKTSGAKGVRDDNYDALMYLFGIRIKNFFLFLFFK